MPAFSPEEVVETFEMLSLSHLNIRAVTLGGNLLDCVDPSIDLLASRVTAKITRLAGNLVPEAEALESRYGVPIVNKRIAVTPAALLLGTPVSHSSERAASALGVRLAETLDRVAVEVSVNYVGGYSALVQRGLTRGDLLLIDSIPEALARTERVCSCVNIADTKVGINSDAARKMSESLTRTAEETASRNGLGCTKLITFANAPGDNPFVQGAFPRGWGAVCDHQCRHQRTRRHPGRRGEEPGFRLPGSGRCREESGVQDHPGGRTRRSGARGAPRRPIRDRRPLPRSDPPEGGKHRGHYRGHGDRGLWRAGFHRGARAPHGRGEERGNMARTFVGGLSGAFIPLSEDSGMVDAAQAGSLTLEKLEAMTSVCSSGLDMIPIPGDTPPETIAAIIMDEMAIGVMNDKPVGVRIIPVPGKQVGEQVEFGGLLGRSVILPVSHFSSRAFMRRGGQIPSPIVSLKG